MRKKIKFEEGLQEAEKIKRSSGKAKSITTN